MLNICGVADFYGINIPVIADFRLQDVTQHQVAEMHSSKLLYNLSIR